MDLKAKSEKVLQLTKDMIAAIQTGEAAQFKALSTEREGLINQIALASDEDMTDMDLVIQIREELTEARQLNQELTESFESLQQDLLDEKTLLKKGQQMQKAYGQPR